MGDALHLLPVLTELQKQLPDIKVDWMIEESFAEIPHWHPVVDRVIPVATRRWRKIQPANISQIRTFLNTLRTTAYDVVIDAQGLMKSAVFARLARIKPGGRRIGFSGDSIKESPAAWLYKETFAVARKQHAIARLQKLFSQSFKLSECSDTLDYGLTRQLKRSDVAQPNTIIFLHGTTWPAKHLPPLQWRQLRDKAIQAGYRVLLPWGNDTELVRAKWIAQNHPNVEVLPKLSLGELKEVLSDCSAAIAVDTGLGHLAAALGVPAVSIYGATDAQLTGAMGENQIHLQTQYQCSPCLLKECDKLKNDQHDPPCYLSLGVDSIWNRLNQ